MPWDAYYKDKSVEDLLAALYDTAQPGSPVHEQQKMAIWLLLAKGLTDATNGLAEATREASRQSTRLQSRIVWLTIVLAIGAVVAAAAAVIGVLRP